MYVTLGKDTLMSFVNPNNTISARESEVFFAEKDTRIRFSGKMVATNDICFDTVTVTVSEDPALSLPLAKVVDMGKTEPGGQLQFSLPVEMKNGSAMLNFSAPEQSMFSIQGEPVLDLNEDESLIGSVAFAFNAPQETGNYTGRITVDCGEDFAARVIWLNASVTSVSAVAEHLAKKLKFYVRQREIHVDGISNLRASLYTMTGLLLQTVSATGSVPCILRAPFPGAYLLHVLSDDESFSEKLIVN
jgi:hypothetical protein